MAAILVGARYILSKRSVSSGLFRHFQPVCVLQNNKQNQVVRESMALVPVLRQASADLAAGRPLNVAALLQLSSAQASLPAVSVSNIHIDGDSR